MTSPISAPPSSELPSLVRSSGFSRTQQHEQLVAGIDRFAAVLPPMPGIVARLRQELENEWVNIQRLANLVRSDPMLAGSVLRVANSPYWRGSREVVEIEEAIQRMGMETLRSLAVVLSIKSSTFSDKGPAGATMRDFWRHGLLVALGSVQIARRSPIDRKGLEQVWMAGLLHDVGALLAPVLYKDAWSAAVAEIENACAESAIPVDESEPDAERPAPEPPPRIDLIAVEKRHMAIEHAHVGAVFVEKQWRLPDPIPLLVETWPDPTRLEPPLLAWAVARADQAAQVAGICWQPERTRVRELSRLEPESGAGPACDPDFCMECVEKSIAMADAILSGS